MFTYVCSCLPMFTRVHLFLLLLTRTCLPKFTHVLSCLSSYPCFTTVYSCMFSYVYTCFDIYFSPSTQVYLCLLVLTYIWDRLLLHFSLCLPMFTSFTRVYLHLHLFTCLPMFTRLYLSLLVFTYVYNFLLVHVYLCLHMFTRV